MNLYGAGFLLASSPKHLCILIDLDMLTSLFWHFLPQGFNCRKGGDWAHAPWLQPFSHICVCQATRLSCITRIIQHL